MSFAKEFIRVAGFRFISTLVAIFLCTFVISASHCQLGTAQERTKQMPELTKQNHKTEEEETIRHAKFQEEVTRRLPECTHQMQVLLRSFEPSEHRMEEFYVMFNQVSPCNID